MLVFDVKTKRVQGEVFMEFKTYDINARLKVLSKDNVRKELILLFLKTYLSYFEKYLQTYDENFKLSYGFSKGCIRDIYVYEE